MDYTTLACTMYMLGISIILGMGLIMISIVLRQNRKKREELKKKMQPSSLKQNSMFKME